MVNEILMSQEPLWKLILSNLIMFGFGMFTIWQIERETKK